MAYEGRKPYIFTISIILTIIALSVLLGRAFGFFGVNSNKQHEETNDDTKMLDKVMEYIRMNHSEAAPFIQDEISWTEISQDIRAGYSNYTYACDGWNVSIGHATSAEAVYEVRAEHNENIIWEGKIEEDMIVEKEYAFNKTKEEGGIQTIVMEYIKSNHPDAAVFIGNTSEMVWNKTSSEWLAGYSKFIYNSDEWKMTIGYAITAELQNTYEIIVENKKEGITWTGTMYNRTINETSFIQEN